MYYKVVRRIDNILVSAVVNTLETKVQYLRGQFVGPIIGGSKLFAFNDLRAAEKFKFNNCGEWGEIWRCETINPSLYEKSLLVPTNVNLSENINTYWHDNWPSKYSDGCEFLECPPFTIACDMVKLLSMVP